MIRIRGRVAAALTLVALCGGVGTAYPAQAAEAACGQRTQPVFLPELTTPVVEYGRDSLLDAGGFSGKGVLVAVVDSGVTAANPHFSADPEAVAAGTSLLPATPDLAELRDPAGRADRLDHGTIVAGLIAARKVSGSGVRGLAPEATILPVQAFATLSADDPRLGASSPTPIAIATGIRYAVDRGARVIAVPVAMTSGSDELAAAVTYAHDKGSLVIASAGDHDAKVATNGPRYPAAYPTVVGVTALAESGAPSPQAVHGEHVDVAAPAQNFNGVVGAFGDCLVAQTPSSDFATGLVAGAATLLVQSYPQATPDEWSYRLLASAVRPQSDRRDPILGWGVLAPHDALTITLDPTRVGPPRPGTSQIPLQSDRTRGTPIILGADPTSMTRQAAWWVAGGLIALVLGLIMVRALRQSRPSRG